MLAVNLL